MTAHTYGKGWHGARHAQAGQALVEALVLCLALVIVWAAFAWLARLQNIALQSQHASAFAAFAASRHWEQAEHRLGDPHFFAAPSHAWRTTSGQAMLWHGSQVQLTLFNEPRLTAAAQAASTPESLELARQLRAFDNGLLRARVQVWPLLDRPENTHRLAASQAPTSLGLGLRWFNSHAPRITRHTAILTGAGHASSDAQAALRLHSSPLAWATAQQASQAAGVRVNTAVAPIDAAWNRPALELDWLTAWQRGLPETYLRGQPAAD